MPSRFVALLASLVVLLAPSPGRAIFHIGVIYEVMSGAGGDPAAQYVVIRMGMADQNFVANSLLAAFNCDGTVRQDLLIVPGNVGASGPGVPWIMASKSPIGGIVPDFTWPSGSIPTPCGMVCWGAPGSGPPAPGTWDHNDPNNYVDCVAYGGYTGPTKTADPDPDGVNSSSGSPTSLPPGDGTFSLGRITVTNDNATDFTLVCPAPTNNAGMTGSFGPCTPPTTATTTTSTTSTTSTTTLPQSKCTAKKISLAGKKAGSKEKCYAKAVGKGIVLEPGCLQSAEAKFAAGWMKLEGKSPNDCLTSGDESSIEGMVDDFVNDVATALNGIAPKSKCSSKKYALVGKKALGKAKCQAKAVGKGIAVDPECVAKVEGKFSTGWAKAESAGGCNSTGDEGSLESTVDAAIAGIVDALGP
jgi:hypothetical protein